MPSLYFSVGQVTTGTVNSEDLLVVRVPATKRPAITLTNAGQLLGYNNGAQVQALMTLGDSGLIAARLMLGFKSQLETTLEEEQLGLELQLEDLSKELGVLNSTNGRAQVFLNYAWEGGNVGSSIHNVRTKIADNGQITNNDLTPIVQGAYRRLSTGKGVTAAIKDKILQYIIEGEADDETLALFAAKNVNPVFQKLAQYRQITRHMQQRAEGRETEDLQGLQNLVIESIEAIKSGYTSQAKIEFSGLSFDVYQALQQLTGAPPGKQFLCEVNRAVSGKSREGFLAPFRYSASKGNDGFEPGQYHFLSPQKFTQVITVFDAALSKTLLAGVAGDEELQPNERLAVHDAGLLVRAVMQKNPAIQKLYPDERVNIPNPPGLSAKIASRVHECYQNGQVAKLTAQQLGMSEGELSQEGLEALVALLDKLMPVLPFEVYDYILTRNRLATFQETTDFDWFASKIKGLGERLEEMKMSPGLSRKAATTQYRALARRNNTLLHQYRGAVNFHKGLVAEWQRKGQLLRDRFGIDATTMTSYDKETIEEALQLSGEQKIGFIRRVLSPEMEERAKSNEQQPSPV